ncbi:hypothetical protein MSG28_008061 [Choristoneura fumiferana]|uniref:Uncharacterized protein n=1 Tax=Choristoneura fumiferana TaxID=7141 RepID=A0ACC0J9X9_CHOFU|nr:hypothetical protein MSG28_008061 [Choristoneura fumiferana]
MHIFRTFPEAVQRVIASKPKEKEQVVICKPVARKPVQYVRTLWHRLPSDSGHLAFNEGERLRLILEVDDQHLLCCRGDHKGLVPRDAVLPDDF